MEVNDDLIVEVVARTYKDLIQIADLFEYYSKCSCHDMPKRATIFTGVCIDIFENENVNEFKKRIYARMEKETKNIIKDRMIDILCEYPDVVLKQVYDYIQDHYKLFYYSILFPLIKDGDNNEKCTTNKRN